MYVIEVQTTEGDMLYLHCHYPTDGYLVLYPAASLYSSEDQANRVARDILNRANLRNIVYNYRVINVP